MNLADLKHEERALLIKPLLAIFILACLSVGAFYAVSQHYIDTLFQKIEKKYRRDLINIVSVARNAVEPVLIKTRSGEISRDEAIRQVRQLIRTMTYEDQDGKNYVFMSSYGGIMLVQPYEPAKELTNQWNLQDAPQGIYIIRELVKAAKMHPTGSFVRYHYHLPGVHATQEKLAYVVGLPELECYIGTGMYMAQSIREQRAILTKVKYASLWLFLALLLPISGSVLVILRRNRRLLSEIRIREKAEEEVKISEAKYRSIFENAGKGIFQTTADGHLISANPAFARIFGFDSPGRIIENGVTTGQHYADSGRREELIRLINEKGHVEDYEVQMKHKDGSLVWVSVSSRAVRDDAGNFLFYEGTVEDIHARRQAQEDVKSSRKLLNDILQAASDFAIIATDTQGLITVFNRGAELMLGCSADEMLGKKTPLVFHLESEILSRSKELTERLGRPVEGFQVFTILPEPQGSETREWTYVRKDGSFLSVSLVSTAIRSDRGEITGYLGIASDITRRKHMEKEVSRLAAIVRHASELINLADADGKMVFLNEAGMNMLGIDAGDIEKTHIMQVIPDHLKPLVENELLPAMKQPGGAWEGDLQYLNLKTKTLTDVHAVAFSIGDPDAEHRHYLANISMDISKRKQAEDLLRLSEEKFAKVFIMAPEMIAITRLENGMFADVNLGFEEITGWKRYEAIGKTSVDLKFWFTPEDRTRMVSDLKAGKDVSQREMTFRRKDGSLRTGIYSARMIQIGAEDSLIFVLQDITERKATEKALLEKEERLSAITRNIPGSVFQLYAKTENDYRLTYVSERLTEFLKLPADAHEAFEVFLSHVYDEDKERLLSSIQNAIVSGRSWNFEGRIVTPLYGIMWFQGMATPTRHESDLIYNGIFLDISERKQAEEKSRKSEEKFTKVFMTAPDCIAISRMADGMIIDVNRGFEEITGWTIAEVIGKTSYEINFWADLRDRDFMIDEIKTGRDVLHREFQFRDKDGKVRTGIYSARPIEIAGDQCLVFILNDITDRQRLEEERRKLEQQLFQSQKLDAIGKLASGVAHDFNNILMGIQGNAALMQMDHHPEHPHYQKLRRIEEHVKRGANLTRQLLGFAREGKYEVRTLSINNLIRKVAQFFLETHKEIDADYQLQQDLHAVEADAGQIEQVLLNMFINAAHAMPKGGHLHIRTQNVALGDMDTAAFRLQPGDFVKISISDTGIGMDAETLKRIFEPFFTTRLQEGGSGLGLASAYGIIRNHGGVVTVYSEPGAGSTFNIFLPSSRQKTQADESPVQARLFPGSGGILLVDDEPMILSSASEMLKLLGYSVYTAASGQEAVAVYAEKKDKINLVILDMIMPGMSGAEVLKTLKGMNPNINVILSSGYGMQGEVQKVMETGCRGFIQKPYSFTELSQIVHQVLYPENVRSPG